MAKHKARTGNRRGRTLLTPAPPRRFIFPTPTEVSVTPISVKEALKLANDISLPTMRGVSVLTPSKRHVIFHPVQKGVIKYNYALLR